MNDFKTTIAAFIAATSGLLLNFHVIVPDWLSATVLSIALGVWGYFTNKTKPQ